MLKQAVDKVMAKKKKGKSLDDAKKKFAEEEVMRMGKIETSEEPERQKKWVDDSTKFASRIRSYEGKEYEASDWQIAQEKKVLRDYEAREAHNERVRQKIKDEEARVEVRKRRYGKMK
jgi:hypothetical protein